ncbi:hypothetical protein NY607_12455 [Lysinibacillus sp. A4]|uniref:hypothetical protein n=1 Tax=Lysinibacillus sp. A4 TaxID=2976269 RepID=UPI002175C757|nr:hypothetical protein [Lysinibacillus sp. A4]MCS5501938.1 hypothetical protein [Lysinibacillus sp. A4]
MRNLKRDLIFAGFIILLGVYVGMIEVKFDISINQENISATVLFILGIVFTLYTSWDNGNKKL